MSIDLLITCANLISRSDVDDDHIGNHHNDRSEYSCRDENSIAESRSQTTIPHVISQDESPLATRTIRSIAPLCVPKVITAYSRDNAGITLNDDQAFLLFLKICFLYISRINDRPLVLRIKAIVNKCTSENRRGNPEFSPLRKVVQIRLRVALGKMRWAKVQYVMQSFCNSRGICCPWNDGRLCSFKLLYFLPSCGFSRLDVCLNQWRTEVRKFCIKYVENLNFPVVLINNVSNTFTLTPTKYWIFHSRVTGYIRSAAQQKGVTSTRTRILNRLRKWCGVSSRAINPFMQTIIPNFTSLWTLLYGLFSPSHHYQLLLPHPVVTWDVHLVHLKKHKSWRGPEEYLSCLGTDLNPLPTGTISICSTELFLLFKNSMYIHSFFQK